MTNTVNSVPRTMARWKHCNIIQSYKVGVGGVMGCGGQVGHWWAWRYPGGAWRRRGEGVRMSHPGATKSAPHKHPELHTHSISSIREPLVCLQNVTGWNMQDDWLKHAACSVSVCHCLHWQVRLFLHERKPDLQQFLVIICCHFWPVLQD